jgi:hypothetical protein
MRVSHLALTFLFAFACSMSTFVCITGQVTRLELQSKWLRFLQFAIQSYHVDVALVLAHTNRDTFHRFQRDSQHAFESLDSINQFFLRHANDRLRVEAHEHMEMPAPSVSSQFVRRIAQRVGNVTAAFLEAQNIMRMYDSLRHCWRICEDMMRSRNSSYDFYIRLRDDAFFLDDWLPPAIWLTLAPSAFVTDCLHWRGVNDKTIVCNSIKCARVYFDRLAIEAGFNVRDDVENSETLTATLFSRHNIQIHGVCPDRLPIVKSRTYGGVICFEPEQGLDQHGYGRRVRPRLFSSSCPAQFYRSKFEYACVPKTQGLDWVLRRLCQPAETVSTKDVDQNLW